MVVGRALKGKARGPLIYSGAEISLGKPQGATCADWRVIFWFRVPEPSQRRHRTFESEVTDAKDFELRALACGELEEVAFNVTYPIDMTTTEAKKLLEDEYNARLVKRIGLVGEARRTNVDLVIARS
jgi:hypothetical protein